MAFGGNSYVPVSLRSIGRYAGYVAGSPTGNVQSSWKGYHGLTFDTIMALISIPLLGFGVLSYQTGWGWYVLIVSCIHVVYGLRLFICRGGPLLTPSGLYGLTSAVFLGLPPLWTCLAGVYSIDALDCLVSGISFAALAMTDLISRIGKRRKHIRTATMDTAVELHPTAPRWMLGVSILLFITGSAMKGAELPLPFTKGAVYVSILFSAVGAIIAIKDRRWLLAALACVLTLSILEVYLVVHFTGFGRLIIATLAISILFVTSVIWKRSWMKVIAILAAVPLLVAGAQIRSSSVITARSLLQDPLSGLYSMLAPYFEFAEILKRVGMPGSLREFEFQWGKAAIPALSWLVPRWIWPSKPMALGHLLTLWFQPELASVGHTWAGGSYLGAFYVNFGFLGLMMAPLLLGRVLRLLDAVAYQLAAGPRSSHMEYCLRLVSTCIVLGSIADYVWGGTMMLSTRAIPRLVFLIPLAAIGLLRRMARGRKSGAHNVIRDTQTNLP